MIHYDLLCYTYDSLGFTYHLLIVCYGIASALRADMRAPSGQDWRLTEGTEVRALPSESECQKVQSFVINKIRSGQWEGKREARW